MTTGSAAPEVLHPWAIYLQACEEARRRGDRRAGTDHVVLALLAEPSIQAALGVSRKTQVTAQQVLAQILTLQPPDPAAVLLGALGVNPPEVRRRLDAATPGS